MTLGELIGHIYKLPGNECTFAKEPCFVSSEETTALLDENFRVPDTARRLGLDYFLEVHIAKGVLKVLGKKPITNEDKLRVLIFYALHRAYPEWFFKLSSLSLPVHTRGQIGLARLAHAK